MLANAPTMAFAALCDVGRKPGCHIQLLKFLPARFQCKLQAKIVKFSAILAPGLTPPPTPPPQLPSRPAQVRHAQRAHRHRQTPHRPKHRAHQLGVVGVCALAKCTRYLVKHQPAARDDDVESEKGQQGFGVEVHGCSLFCFCPGG